MSATPTTQLEYRESTPDPSTIGDRVLAWAARREINRANAQHSTGPRTAAGKARSSLNALSHGLTASSPVLPSEDRAAYDQHCRQLFDEYQPATPTETELVQELADTSWRLRRIPLLEADLLARASNPPSEAAQIAFDIVDAHNLLAKLSLHGARLSRQFQRCVETLRNVQSERRERERHDLRDAAELLTLHQHEGTPWNPADDGFVFSYETVAKHAKFLMRRAQAVYRTTHLLGPLRIHSR